MRREDFENELDNLAQSMRRDFAKSNTETGVPKPFKVHVTETIIEPEKFRLNELAGPASETAAYDRATVQEEFPPDSTSGTGIMHCGRFIDNLALGGLAGVAGISDGSIGNFWGGWYWPTYNHGKTAPNDASHGSYFRHVCLRGIVVNYDLDTTLATVVTAHEVQFVGSRAASLTADFELGDTIDWYFAPTGDALAELITKANDFWDEVPPDSGTIQLTIYMEMHREYAYTYNTIIYPPNPPGHTQVGRNAARGGHALKSYISSHQSAAHVVGDETLSVPVVLKACWQRI